MELTSVRPSETVTANRTVYRIVRKLSVCERCPQEAVEPPRATFEQTGSATPILGPKGANRFPSTNSTFVKIPQRNSPSNDAEHSEITGFRRCFFEISAFLGCYAAQVCDWLPTFRDTVSILFRGQVVKEGSDPLKWHLCALPKLLCSVTNLRYVTCQNNNTSILNIPYLSKKSVYSKI